MIEEVRGWDITFACPLCGEGKTERHECIDDPCIVEPPFCPVTCNVKMIYLDSIAVCTLVEVDEDGREEPYEGEEAPFWDKRHKGERI